MDNRITKQRLSNVLVYGWVLLAFIIGISIVFWELIFTSTAVGLMTGQRFSVFYDESVGSSNADNLDKLIIGKNAFSFDVQEVTHESFSAEYNTLSSRVSAHQGSVLITDTTKSTKGDYDGYNRFCSRLDSYPIFSTEELLNGAKEYLKEFLPNGSQTLDPCEYANLSPQKIEKRFYDRLSNDNRFLTWQAKENGVKLEKQRIEKLCYYVKEFDRFLQLDEQNVLLGGDSYFYRCTKYEQAYKIESDVQEKAKFFQLYEKEKLEHRENLRYALRVEALNGGSGKYLAQNYFYKNSSVSCSDVVIACFNYTKYDHDLQYEVLGFYVEIVKAFSTILD